jgi:phosphotransacetylase
MSIENNLPILLNEADNPVINNVTQRNREGYNLRVEKLPLKGEDGQPGSLELLLQGKVSAIVTGIDSTTAAVVKAAKEVIGPDDDKLISSFFSMEKEGRPSLYLGDCGVVPKPNRDKLFKIAKQTADSVNDMDIAPKVAFLASDGESQGEDIVQGAAEDFHKIRPQFELMGKASWKEARASGANTFIFPDLNSGNIVYKILHDHDGGGWQAVESSVDTADVLQKGDRQLFISKHTAHTPTVDQLVDSAVEAYEAARAASPTGKLPAVALLSFSTGDSSLSSEVHVVREAYTKLKAAYPDMPLMGPVQWDSARDPEVYSKKTGRKYPGQPSVFVFPNRDSASLAYEALQEPDVGGLTAVGPVIQGLKNNLKVVDLSRGANEDDVEGALRIVGKSKRADSKSDEEAA